MQQTSTRPTGRLWLRLVLALAWMAAAMAMPITAARACSCSGADLPAAVARADVAFVGTVVDQRDAGSTDPLSGPLVEYAFRVEAASTATPEITLVRAGTRDASCGVSFGEREEWLVIIPPRADMGDFAADTHLCAGNTRTVDMQPHEVADVEALLTVPPTPAPREPAADGKRTVALFAAAGAVLTVLAVGVLAALRHPRRGASA